MKLAVTALAAAIVIAAGAILFSLGSTARGARPTVVSIPGLHLDDLPLERAFSFAIPATALSIVPSQSQQFGLLDANVVAYEQQMPPNIGIVLTEISTIASNAASARYILLIDGQPRHASPSGYTVATDRAMRPILVNPGSVLRIEFDNDNHSLGNTAINLQGYYVFDSEITPQ